MLTMQRLVLNRRSPAYRVRSIVRRWHQQRPRDACASGGARHGCLLAFHRGTRSFYCERMCAFDRSLGPVDGGTCRVAVWSVAANDAQWRCRRTGYAVSRVCARSMGVKCAGRVKNTPLVVAPVLVSQGINA